MEQQVNLWQPILRAEKRLFSAAAIALGLLLLAACLAALAGFAGWRTARVERAVAALESQESQRAALAARAVDALAPREGLAALEARAAALAGDIAARERALAAVGTGSAASTGAFAARLAALGDGRVDGLWLDRIVFAPDGGVALRGLTDDPRHVPAYLAALRDARALHGMGFERLEIRALPAADAPAVAAFVARGGGVALELDVEREAP